MTAEKIKNKFMAVLKGFSAFMLTIAFLALVVFFCMAIAGMILTGQHIVQFIITEVITALAAALIFVVLWKISKTAIRVVFVLLSVILLVGAIPLMLLKLFISSDVFLISIGAAIVGLIPLVLGIIFKKKMVIVFSGIAIAVWYTALWGAVNDFPKFIRQIQGTDFVGWWLIFFTILLVVSLAVVLVICKMIAYKNIDKAQKKIYSDSDLMIL